MRVFWSILMVAMLGLMGVGVSGCDRDAEEAVDEAGDELRQAGDEVQDAVEDAADEVRDATN